MRRVAKIALGDLLHPAGTQNTSLAILSRIVSLKMWGAILRFNELFQDHQLLLLTLCGVDADPYQRYAELATLQSSMRRVDDSPNPQSKEFC